MRLSIWLNNFENYRTESEYRTNLIIKVFSFRFVNYFATLYYYAFVSSIVSEEELGWCGCIELFDVYCHDITSPVVRRKKHRKTTSIVKDEEGTAFGSGAVGLRARMCAK